MSNTEIEPHMPSDPQDDELTRYQSVSGLAFVALLLGLFSWTALFTPWLWPVAFAGVITALAALVQIRRRAPTLLGRKPAIIGLLLSVAFSFAGPTETFAYRWLISREGRQIAAEFLREVQQGQPEAAYQWTLPSGRRVPPTVDLAASYYAGSEARTGLEAFVARPENVALLALGGKARIRYYDTDLQIQGDEGDRLRLIYAVTYDQAAGKYRGKNSFFIGLNLRRTVLPAAHVVDWQIEGVQGGIQADNYASR